jgi:hypothetical protein
MIGSPHPSPPSFQRPRNPLQPSPLGASGIGLVSQSPTAPQSTKALADPIEDSISVSSDSSSIFQQSPGSSAHNSVAAEDDEETDTDEVQVVE